jgi:hypothetical protein
MLLTAPCHPWEELIVDQVTNKPESTASGSTGIFVIVNPLTKMATYLFFRQDIDCPELVAMLFRYEIFKQGVPSVWKQFRTVTSTQGPGPNRTVAQLAVLVVNIPELPSRVRFHGKLPTRLNWAGCQQVAQRVHL